MLDYSSTMDLQIRPATPDEAEALTALAHAAKRHWGYPEEWISHWQTDLTITPDFIATNEVFVATIDNEIAGCCALVLSEKLIELEHMWIDPKHMRKGIGRALFEHTKRRAEELGSKTLELSADPNAESFYERMGAKRIGEVPADVLGQSRVLPRMRIEFGVPPSGGGSCDNPA
ncbi:MAG TPA: GNAT family N-acetyltransferase [Pyrinomonadaceae bacterium]|nr:GNAT family N-acetyltransferase [Pyrinomonadaceae bacterium]